MWSELGSAQNVTVTVCWQCWKLQSDMGVVRFRCYGTEHHRSLICGLHVQESWLVVHPGQDRVLARSHHESRLMASHDRQQARTDRNPRLTLQSDLLRTGWSRDRNPASCAMGTSTSSVEVRPVCLAHLQGVHGTQRSYV